MVSSVGRQLGHQPGDIDLIPGGGDQAVADLEDRGRSELDSAAGRGDAGELTVMGALTGVEMGFELAGVPYKKGGVQAAMSYLAETARTRELVAAE